MQDIISETMFVVRSRMKGLPLNSETFDLRDFCELLVADQEPCGRLQFHHGEGPFSVVADAPRLRHALENLLSNGLKYSDQPVVVTLTNSVRGFRIEVTDRGIGIPTEEQAGLFEPFFRASNTKGKPGHGLGLCVAKRCIEEHGGSLHFLSLLNQGTTFIIRLPASPPPSAVTSQRKPDDVQTPVAELGGGGSPSESPIRRQTRPNRNREITRSPPGLVPLKPFLEVGRMVN